MSDNEQLAIAEPAQVKVPLKASKNKHKISKTGLMVLDAIKNLNERNGSTLAKIRNYITAHNEIDMNRYKSLFKKFIVSALNDGIIKNASAKSGALNVAHFKLVETANKKKVAKPEKQVEEEEVVPKKKKKTAIKKVISKNLASPQVKKPKSKSIKSDVAVGAKKKAKSQGKVVAEGEQPIVKKSAAGKTSKQKESVTKPKKTAKKAESKQKSKGAEDGQKDGATKKKVKTDKKKATATKAKKAESSAGGKKMKKADSKENDGAVSN